MKEYLRLLTYIKPYKMYLLLSGFLIIIFTFSSAISVYLSIPLLKTLFMSGNENQTLIHQYDISNIFNNLRYKLEIFIFSGETKYSALVKVCVLILIFYFIKNLSGYLQSILTQYVEKSLITDIRRKLYHKYNSLSLKYFSEKKSGDLISRIITDVNLIQNTVSVTFTNLLKDPAMIIVFFLMALFLSWKLTLLSLAIIPVSMLIIIHIGKKLRKYSERLQEKLSDFTSTISETIYGSKIIRAFSMEKFENKKFEIKLKDYFRTIMKTAIYSNLTSPLTEYVSVLIGVFIIWFGGREIFLYNSLNPEDFIGFLLITFQLMTPIKDLSQVNNKIQESSAASHRIFQILDTKPDIIDSDEAVSKSTFDTEIKYSNVSFHYDDDIPILHNVNLTIRKNEVIAIVGISGVGKSTLIDLLPRFYDVTLGEIFIDGINVKKLKLNELRNLFAIVTQEIILFNDTIRNNIAYGLENISEDKIIDAAIKANAHDFIIQTENSYNTIIGERGIKLSGGQKQRISIARALLKNAPILIFDEATSSLDSESEHLIQKAIEKIIKNNTSIIIAHRLSTIKNADRIVVLHEGKITTIGTHNDLIKDNDSIYKKLYEMQFA